MNGSNVAYHLRTNKFVERQLFLDLLDFVRVWNGSSKYLYASMGGRYLEDFKLMNDRFAIERMISIEVDETTWNRQRFNCPLGFIDCRHQTSSDFIVDFDRLTTDPPDARIVVWLDYAVANDRGSQLQEYEELVSKLASGDVVKITLNANPRSFRQPRQFDIQSDFCKAVIDNLNEQLGDYAPKEGFTQDDLTPQRFAQRLTRSVKLAALKGIESSSEISVLPLASYRYRDGEHQMLTVTAILADDDLEKDITGDQIFQQWLFRSKEWDNVHEIMVPQLSQKEREYINGLISTNDEYHIHEAMPFRLDANKNESLKLFKSYVEHYRHYPTFGRVYV